MIEFTTQQQEGISRIREWLDSGDRPVFRFFGYAGTGKTTIARELQKHVPTVQYASLTGKAALVMRGKGCENARTIHSMIYRSMDRSKVDRDRLQAELDRAIAEKNPPEVIAGLTDDVAKMTRELLQPRFHLNENAFERVWVEPSYDEERDIDFPGYFRHVDPPDLIVVDECSMVDDRVGRDLESFQIPILVLGDPAQLPPVGGGGYFTGSEKRPVQPDYLLTEIHRQAADNPVLQIATRIRQGEMPPLGQYGESRIVQKGDMKDPAEWLAADQVLCGKNDTRHAVNRRLRALRGYDGYLPCVGERVICLRNNHDRGLLNGSMWEPTLVEDIPDSEYFRMALKSLDDEHAEPVDTIVHKPPFFDADFKFTDSWHRRTADEFDFGHCITTHKAQGSEWKSIVYIDEWPRWGEERRRHQYTGVTRASEKVTVVKW